MSSERLVLAGYLSKAKRGGFWNTLFTQWNERWFVIEPLGYKKPSPSEEAPGQRALDEDVPDDDHFTLDEIETPLPTIAPITASTHTNPTEFQLSYYSAPDKLVAIKSVPLRDVQSVAPFKDGSGSQSVSFIIDTIDRTFLLKAHSFVEMEAWVSGLRSYIHGEAAPTSPVKQSSREHTKLAYGFSDASNDNKYIVDSSSSSSGISKPKKKNSGGKRESKMTEKKASSRTRSKSPVARDVSSKKTKRKLKGRESSTTTTTATTANKADPIIMEPDENTSSSPALPSSEPAVQDKDSKVDVSRDKTNVAVDSSKDSKKNSSIVAAAPVVDAPQNNTGQDAKKYGDWDIEDSGEEIVEEDDWFTSPHEDEL